MENLSANQVNGDYYHYYGDNKYYMTKNLGLKNKGAFVQFYF